MNPVKINFALHYAKTSPLEWKSSPHPLIEDSVFVGIHGRRLNPDNLSGLSHQFNHQTMTIDTLLDGEVISQVDLSEGDLP